MISKEWILWKIYENDRWISYRCLGLTTSNVWKKKRIGFSKTYYDGEIYLFSFYWFGFSLYKRSEEKLKLDFDFH